MAKFPVILNGFTMNAGSRAAYGLWRHPSDHACRHADLDGWIEPARTPEGGGFDCRFIADVPGLLDVCDGEPDVSLARGVQSPAAGPLLRAAARDHSAWRQTAEVAQ